MNGNLSQSQIEDFLSDSYVGRVGGYNEDKVYIVPITFFFDKASYSIVSHSGPGMKLDMLRKHPDICFQVDRIDNIGNWQSAILWGRFEELHGTDARNASHKFVQGLRKVMNNPAHHEHVKFLHDMSHSLPGDHSVIYRINISEISGRFERSAETSASPGS